MSSFDETTAPTPEEEERVWAELDACVLTKCEDHESIDDALRTWLELATSLRDWRKHSQEDILTCAQMLLDSEIFRDNRSYVRTQLIHSFLQEPDTGPVHIISAMLLLDGHYDESTFPQMVEEACFPRLVELINSEQKSEDARLHRLLLQLMYEMSRIERLKPEELSLVDDDFIHDLFKIIEGVSNDVNDPYHYPTIRVLLVMNEQYMLASTDAITDANGNTIPLTNRIVKCLSLHGPRYRTFGENIILLLNRETETSLQLLILKLLYLLFTTKATYEYFYTNDLRVLLDVIIRNLMDLPDERMSLRHTYLRVLHPLLAHTQLSQQPHYKHDEVLRLITILRGSHNAHFAPADETTVRLVDRVAKVDWLKEMDDDASGQAETARKLLGISLSQSQGASSVSVLDVAGVKEKPGVQTPSRTNGDIRSNHDPDTDANVTSSGSPKRSRPKKPLPDIPRHRHGNLLDTPTNPAPNVAPRKIPPKAPPPRRFGKTKVAESHPIAPIEEGVPK